MPGRGRMTLEIKFTQGLFDYMFHAWQRVGIWSFSFTQAFVDYVFHARQSVRDLGEKHPVQKSLS